MKIYYDIQSKDVLIYNSARLIIYKHLFLDLKKILLWQRIRHIGKYWSQGYFHMLPPSGVDHLRAVDKCWIFGLQSERRHSEHDGNQVQVRAVLCCRPQNLNSRSSIVTLWLLLAVEPCSAAASDGGQWRRPHDRETGRGESVKPLSINRNRVAFYLDKKQRAQTHTHAHTHSQCLTHCFLSAPSHAPADGSTEATEAFGVFMLFKASWTKAACAKSERASTISDSPRSWRGHAEPTFTPIGQRRILYKLKKGFKAIE